MFPFYLMRSHICLYKEKNPPFRRLGWLAPTRQLREKSAVQTTRLARSRSPIMLTVVMWEILNTNVVMIDDK